METWLVEGFLKQICSAVSLQHAPGAGWVTQTTRWTGTCTAANTYTPLLLQRVVWETRLQPFRASEIRWSRKLDPRHLRLQFDRSSEMKGKESRCYWRKKADEVSRSSWEMVSAVIQDWRSEGKRDGEKWERSWTGEELDEWITRIRNLKSNVDENGWVSRARVSSIESTAKKAIGRQWAIGKR